MPNKGILARRGDSEVPVPPEVQRLSLLHRLQGLCNFVLGTSDHITTLPYLT